MAIEFVIDAADRKRIMKMLSAETASRIGQIMFRAFQQAGSTVEGRVRDNVSGSILKIRSSRLSGSIGSRVEINGDQITATIGSGARDNSKPVPYASIHETGGTILPKKGMFLTIPTDNARTEGGDTKAGYTAANLRDGNIPGFSGSVIIGRTIFGIMQGVKNKLLPLFTLVRSVDIPARRYLSVALEAEEKKIPDMILQTVARELNRAANGN